MKKYIYLFMLLGFILQGCDNKSDSNQTTQQDKKEIVVGLPPSMRSEESRVGKECISRRSPAH